MKPDTYRRLCGLFFWLWAAAMAVIVMALLTSCSPWKSLTIEPGEKWVYVGLGRSGPMAQTNTVISVKHGQIEYEYVAQGVTNRERHSYEWFLYGSVRIR